MTTDKQLLPLQIYGPSFSNFVRSVMILCEENSLDYQTGFDCTGALIEFKSDEHFALHPYGKLPVLIHGELVLPETASICRYINTLASSEDDKSLITSQVARIDAFSAITSIYLDKAIMRDYILEFAFPKGEGGEVRFEVAVAAQGEVHKALNIIRDQLTKNDTLLAGLTENPQMTIADALIAPMLHYISTLPSGFNLLSEYPELEFYLAHLMKRASCKKVLISK